MHDCPLLIVRALTAVFEHPSHLLRLDEQRLKLAAREPGTSENIFDGERALRHVRGVLE